MKIDLKTLFARRAVRYGALALVLIVLGSFLFSNGENGREMLTVAAGDFVQEVSVSGRVVAAQNVDLGFSQTGRISAVYADVGDTVARGTTIAAIENGDVYADILQKEAAYEAAQAKLRSLEAGTRPEQIAITRSKVESAEATLAQERLELLDELNDAYTDADNAIRNKVDQLFKNPRTSSAEIDVPTGAQSKNQIESERVAIESSLTTWQGMLLPLSSASADEDILAATSQAQSTLSRISSFLQIIARVVADLSPGGTLTQTTIDGYRSDIATARSSVSAAATALTAAVTARVDAAAALATAQRNLELEEAGATQEDIEQQQANVKAALADLERARALYRKTLVTAPFSGIITKMDAKVGAAANANDSLISMISSDTLQIESFVPEINAPLLEIGDSARITLDAYGEDTPFAATIVALDPAETIRDGVSTYRATLQFTERDARVRSGMTANIEITTEKKENVIAVPQNVVFSDVSREFVYVQEGEEVIEREVETGNVSSLGALEIRSGLSEGDVVVLTTERL